MKQLLTGSVNIADDFRLIPVIGEVGSSVDV
jgi:hypothetical protein